MNERKNRIPKIKLWLIIRGFTKKAFKRLVVRSADAIAEEVFKDFARVYEEMHHEKPSEKMHEAMRKSRQEFVAFVKNHKAKEIVNEAKEYFIRG